MSNRPFLSMLALVAGFAAGPAQGAPVPLQVVGLTADQRLVVFRDNSPQKTRTIGSVSGLTGADTKLVGIDFRPATGALYGLGDGGGVYTLDVTNAQATFKAQLSAHVTHEIGAIARPDEIRFAEALPKTRSGKIMRRLLRDIAAGRPASGDTTTLDDLSVVAELHKTEE